MTHENLKQRDPDAEAESAGKVDARAVLQSSFPTALQSAEARENGVLTNRDARRVVDAEEAKYEQAAAWSPPQTLIDGFGGKVIKVGNKAMEKKAKHEQAAAWSPAQTRAQTPTHSDEFGETSEREAEDAVEGRVPFGASQRSIYMF